MHEFAEISQRQAGRLTPTRSRQVTLLTGCKDPHYAFGLAMALNGAGVHTDVVGSEDEDNPEFHRQPNLRFIDLRRRRQSERNLGSKLIGWASYYMKLLHYTANTPGRIIHILWNNKFELLDRTLLMLCYKLMGKKVIRTAHNVNQARRDSIDSVVNRMTLRIQYRLSDHIFVHTLQMKDELCTQFGVRPCAVTVVPFGLNNAVPNTGLTISEAKQKVGVTETERTVLFFGGIKPYKGLGCLVEAFRRLAVKRNDYRLIIAGEHKKEAEQHFAEIKHSINSLHDPTRIIQRIRYIPNEEAEVYFKAADVIALPYTEIFQSGILFLAFSFGLPAIATDVGSFRDDIIEGETGFLCKRGDSLALANTLERYFASDLFKSLPLHREQIRTFAETYHSWDTVGKMTRDVYGSL